MEPLISVIMPVWNGERYLAAAVESVLGQTFGDFEFIVMDDGSDDRTAEILRSYRDQRLRVHRLNHAGIVAALNFGVGQARAAWIARQDADDLSHPNRLLRQWEAVRRNSEAVLCFTDHAILNDEGRSGAGEARLPRTRAFLALRLCYQCPFAHSTVLFSKLAFQEAGGYLEAERHAEDYALWGRLLELGEFLAVPQKLVNFRVHEGSISKQSAAAQEHLTTQIAIRNCRRFMRLDEPGAARAAEILSSSTAHRSLMDWFWFLTHCAPRLRWKSAETAGWLAWQTVKLLQRA